MSSGDETGADASTDPGRLYRFPYPSPELAERHPFVELDASRRSAEEMTAAADEFLSVMQRRRSVRMFSDEAVPRHLIERAVETAATAPSGAHKQPWSFVAIGDPDLKRRIREAAEAEERVNYLDSRLNDEWQAALAPLGTDHHKEFLEVVPWIVVLFEQRYELLADGSTAKNYYVKESVGIAAGMFVTALHTMGLATLPHTPSPMAFLAEVLERPDNERAFALFPVGYPLPGVHVPDLGRKPLESVLTIIDSERRG